jgi:glycosyltransferase involved in cell wall biosynthesis
VVGTGPEFDRLRSIAGPTVTFHGPLPDSETTDLMRRCRHFILPGKEDFGISAVEAQAAGRPVIAFGEGGARESVIDGETGVLFPRQDVDALCGAIARADSIAWDASRCVASARRFAAPRFREAMRHAVEQAWSREQALG